MRSFVTLVLVLTICVTLAGCGSDAELKKVNAGLTNINESVKNVRGDVGKLNTRMGRMETARTTDNNAVTKAMNKLNDNLNEHKKDPHGGGTVVSAGGGTATSVVVAAADPLDELIQYEEKRKKFKELFRGDDDDDAARRRHEEVLSKFGEVKDDVQSLRKEQERLEKRQKANTRALGALGGRQESDHNVFVENTAEWRRAMEVWRATPNLTCKPGVTCANPRCPWSRR